MDGKEIDICSLCSQLIKAPTDAATAPSNRKLDHHATYGALILSSDKCPVCRMLASLLWSGAESTLRRHGVSDEDIKIHKPGYTLAFELRQSAPRMPSGISWAFWEATLRANNTVFSFVSHFTVLACGEGGE